MSISILGLLRLLGLRQAILLWQRMIIDLLVRAGVPRGDNLAWGVRVGLRWLAMVR
jgi:hypothetical protein